MKVARFFFLFFLPITWGSNALCEETAAPAALSEEAKTNFEWFGSLDFPDVKGRQFVHVATGFWYQSGSEPRRNQYAKGFLLETNETGFTIFKLDLSKLALNYATNGAPDYSRVSFELISLREVASGVLTNHSGESVEQNMRRRFGESISERVEIFALAWACWRNGLDSEAEQLFRRAAAVRDNRRYAAGTDLRAKLEQEIAYSMMWRAVLDCGEPAVSRSQLLQEFQTIVANYTRSEYRQQAQDAIGILTRMVAEDAAHTNVALAELDRLTVEERVRELIFQLRDQNGHQWSQPGHCNIFMDPRTTNSPANLLVNVGYPAVPQLIAALDDSTFSRSIGFHRDFYFSHTVLTVGDCAEAILERIAGRSFYRAASTSGYMSNEHKNAATRATVEAWWEEFQKKGELQMLVDGTETGDGNAPNQAEILTKRYPKSALPALMKGVQSATNDAVKTRLVQLFEKFDSPEALAFLEQEMRKGASSPSVAAASILNRRGNHEAISVMIHEWEKFQNTRPEGAHAPGEVISFLAGVDSPEAINALAQNLEQRALSTRMAVVEAIGDGISWPYSDTNRSLAARNAVEKLLVSALQDEGQIMGVNGSRMGKSYVDPRVCDIAGFFLNQTWSNRYVFDLSGRIKVREIQRINCQNVWRAAQNLPLIPLPPPPTNFVAPSEAAKVTLIEWQTSTAKPSESFTARVQEFRNKLLSPTNIVDLLTNYATVPESGTSGLIFKVRKDDDLTGVKLSVCLLPGTAPNSKDDWRFTESAVLGTKAIDSQFGGTIFATETRSWDGLTATINTLIAASPEMPFEVNVKLYSKGN